MKKTKKEKECDEKVLSKKIKKRKTPVENCITNKKYGWKVAQVKKSNTLIPARNN